jgi:TonB-linked SusC/RagA family outer membrane protein
MRWFVRWEAALVAASGLALLTAGARSAAGQAARGSIQGTVTDAATGAPLANAQVFVAGTQIGALVGANGRYRILNVPAGPVQVTARLIGYGQLSKSATVAAGQPVTVDFALSQSAVTLSDVVVTGTGGAVQEKKLGNTVAKVDLADLRNAPVNTPDEVLQGRVPGVSMLPTSGVTGEGARIRIRGNASLSQSNEPVIYIDGIRMDNGGGGGGGSNRSRLNDIDPSSIERIEILKGAAAATLYGTEASNGVIQIFTKRGTTGAPRWTFQAERAAVAYPDRVEPNAGFARTQEQADDLSALFERPITPFVPFTYPVLQQLWETGYSNIFNASVSGGAPGMTYYVAGRYQDEDGPFTGGRLGGLTKDLLKRYQGTANLNLLPTDNLHLNFRTFYSAGHHQAPSGGNGIDSPYAEALYAKPEHAYCLDANGDKTWDPQYIAGPDQCVGAGNPFGNTAFYTVREALMDVNYQEERHFNGAVTLSYTPTAQLSFDATVGLDNVNYTGENFIPFGRAVDNFTGYDINGSRSVSNSNIQNTTVDTKLHWNRPITSRLSSSFVVGAQGFILNQHNSNGSSSDFAGPGLSVLGAGIQPGVGESILKNVNAGFFGQEQIGYNDWIFLTGGARYDYNSAFGESAGGVLYPKASISIVPSDLGSWSSTTVSALRLRAAIGQSGRQPGAFDKFTTYEATPSQYGGGLRADNPGNPDLKPVISTELELGAELGLFSNKVSVSATYWNRTVNDALVSKQYAWSGGFTSPQLSNVGQMKAHGLELGVSGFVVNRPNVSLDLFANGAYIWQKITDMGGSPPLKVGGSYIRYRNFLKEGYAPGTLFGAKLLTACSTYSQAQADALRKANLCLAPGELPYDLNNDGKPDTEQDLLAALSGPVDPGTLKPLQADDDQDGDLLDHYLGKPYPDWSGGFGGNLTVFRHWKVQTLFEYRAGNYTITDLTDAFRTSHSSIGRNVMRSAEVESTLENPASTADERLVAAEKWLGLVALSPYDGVNQNGNGDFIRWRELSLTYTAPSTLASKLHARDLALTFGVRNLMLWTTYYGADPEVNLQGISSSGGIDNNYIDAIDAYNLPLPRRFSLTLHLGF